jgi:hypothetical protein
MPRYHYGTVPALAWVLNHYFYGAVHYSWLAEEFFPLEGNPKSSNPYLIYGDLYWAWRHDDRFDRFVRDLRKSLREGVRRQQQARVLGRAIARRLRAVCERGRLELFYPVVYRVDMDAIGFDRVAVAGSGLHGSREVLIRDLREAEFDLLFADNAADPEFERLVLDERAGVRRTSSADALSLLEMRLIP